MTTRKAIEQNGVAEQHDAPPTPPEEAVTNGVFVAVARTDDNTGGIARIVAVPQGDVRAAEVPTILEKAVKAERIRMGLD